MKDTTDRVMGIRNIPELKSRFDHVIKHLYEPKERWDLFVHSLPANPRENAVEHGCVRGSIMSACPDWYAACTSCRKHVLDDNDQFYQPAYQNAIVTASEAGRNGYCKDSEERGGEAFVGSNGVFVIVRTSRANGRYVATAYRIVPKGVRHRAVTNQDFYYEAFKKLRDKTSYVTGSR